MSVFSCETVRKHNSNDSAWIIINNNVYDVTQFMAEHPGGDDILLENAGIDATIAFDGINHSEDAKELMKKYKIGEIAQNERRKSVFDEVWEPPAVNTDNSKGAIIVPVIIAVVITCLLMYFG